MAPRPCIDCSTPTSGTRCPACARTTARARQRRTDQRRGSSTQRGYGSAWKSLAAQAIAEQPWCTDCGTPGTPDNPLTGDHLRWPAESVADVAVRCRVHNSARGAARGQRHRSS